MTETYEQLRDSATGEAGEVWRRANCEESNLRATYRQLQEDPRYSAEHKAEKAWADAAGHAYDGARLYEYSRGGGG